MNLSQDHITDWLLWCADPMGSRQDPPVKALSASAFEAFIKRAASHGILGWVLKNSPHVHDDVSLSEIRSKAETTFRMAQLISFKLRYVAAQLTAALDDQAVALVKGPVFADRLYPDPTRRTFSDLDYLTAPSAFETVSSALKAQCFAAYDDPDQEARQEWCWSHRHDSELVIEVHTNLIHSTRMRKRLQLGYDQIEHSPDSPACLLFIAICHGAVSDQFKRIRQLVDICQAARHLPHGPEEEKFAKMVRQQRGEPFAVSALDFAGRIFGDPRCHEIARELGCRWASHATRTLVPPSIFSNALSTNTLAIWRRKTLRELLMRV